MLTIVGDTQSVGRLLEQTPPKIPRSKADDSFSPSSLNLMLNFWLVSAMLAHLDQFSSSQTATIHMIWRLLSHWGMEIQPSEIDGKGWEDFTLQGRKIGVSWVLPSRHHGGFNSHALNDLDDDWGSPILGHLHTIVMINWAVFKTQNVMTLYCWVNRDLQNGWWRSATYWIVWLQSSTTNQGFVSHCSSEQYVVTSSYQQSTSTEAPLTTSLKNSSVNALQEFAKDGAKGPGVFPRQPQTTLTIGVSQTHCWGRPNGVTLRNPE